MEKLKFLVIVLIISATGFMTSCKSDDPTVDPVMIITLNKTEVSLLVGTTETLTASFSPNNEGADKTVTWTSSNAGVATVSNGTITAVAQGEATITVALTSNPAVKAEAKVTVVQPVASVSLNKTDLLIVIGGEEKLIATVLPANADQSVTWSTSDAAIAVVTADGTVQAKTVGTATITVAATSDPTKTASATITVDPGKPAIPAPKVELALTAATNNAVIQFLGDITQTAGPVSGVQALKFSKEAYAKIIHGIPANGGGARVNIYTLLIDFQVPAIDAYSCFYSVCDGSPEELDRNKADGTVFLKPAGTDDVAKGYELGWGIVGLGSGGGYSNLVGNYALVNSDCQKLAPGVTDMKGISGTVKAATWHRLVISYDLSTGLRCSDDGATWMKRYLDGIQIHAGGYSKDSRLCMYPAGVLLHADDQDNGECTEMSIANVAIWDVQLTDGQVEALGKAGEPMKW
jgi:hypothetical protein